MSDELFDVICVGPDGTISAVFGSALTAGQADRRYMAFSRQVNDAHEILILPHDPAHVKGQTLS